MPYKPKDTLPESPNCPTPEAMLEQFLKTTKYRKPGMMPADPFQAARWWMAHQAPGDDFTEGATPPVSKGGSWSVPYADRLIYVLRKFLRLSAARQVYVVEHIEKGVPYKGEDFDMYQKVVDESIKMARNKEQYINDGFKAMHKALRGMTT